MFVACSNFPAKVVPSVWAKVAGPPNGIVVTVSASTSGGAPPLSVRFLGQVNSPNGVSAFSWNFGDGSTNTTSLYPVHTYKVTGYYVATLTVEDGNGNIGSGGAFVTVTSSPSNSASFTETGLPSGTKWNVTLTKQVNTPPAPTYTQSSTTNTIAFSVPYGTYFFVIDSLSYVQDSNGNWWRSYPSQGEIGVNPGGWVQNVNFVKVPSYTMTFTESGLTTGTWSVAIDNSAPKSANAGYSITFPELNGTAHSYEVTPIGGYTAWPSWDSFELVNAGQSQLIKFTTGSLVTIDSQFGQNFLEGISFYNTFGVYTAPSPQGYPWYVSGYLDNKPYTFSSSDYNRSWTISSPLGPINMGNLPPSPSLNLTVTAEYPSGKGFQPMTAIYPINIIQNSTWLASIIDNCTQNPLVTTHRQWNNTYAFTWYKTFDLSSVFNIDIPQGSSLATIGLAGTYTLVPPVGFNFSFNSTGTFSMSSSYTYESPIVSVGPVDASFDTTISVAGVFAAQSNNILWQRGALNLTVDASGSFTFPTPLGFEVDGVNVGLTVSATLDVGFALNMTLASQTSGGSRLLPSLGIMVQTITGQVSFGEGLAVNAGFEGDGWGLELTGGGSLTFTVHFSNTLPPPYISGATVEAKVYLDLRWFCWQTQLWSATGKVWDIGTDPADSSSGSDLTLTAANFTLLPRYYDTPDYDSIVSAPGTLNGIAVNDIYPFTSMSACSCGNHTYILFTNDNTSLNQIDGLCLSGLSFSSGQVTSLKMPIVANEITSNPTLITLPNDTILAAWDSIPFSEMDYANSTSPLAISDVIVQYSQYHPQTGQWDPVMNLTTSKVALAQSLSSGSAGPYALVLEGNGILSSNQSLAEYSLQNGPTLLGTIEFNNTSFNNTSTIISRIVSFNASSQITVLRLSDGSYEVLNLTSATPIPLPSVGGYEQQVRYKITDVQLATNSLYSLGVLYQTSNSTRFCIYNVSSRASSWGMTFAQTPTSFTFAQEGSEYRLITSDASGITVYFIGDNSAGSPLFYPMQNITSMGSTITGSNILVYATENYGNSTDPLLNLAFTSVPDLFNWPMFHDVPSHAGYSMSTAPTTNQTMWTYTTGGMVTSSPAVVNGIVYVGSDDGNVYALNATSGALIWKYTTGGAVGSSPAVAGGMVFVGSANDLVYALDASTGALVWNYTTGGAVGSSPAVVNGIVYVGSDDGRVYALNATTGALMLGWPYATGGAVGSSPAVAGGVVYVGDHNGYVFALNAMSGKLIRGWPFATGSPVPSSPVVVGGVVYVGSDNWNVYALNATTGAYIWSSYVFGSVPSSLAVAGGVVYVGSEDHDIYALNATTGALMLGWPYTTGAGTGFSSPAVADGMVFVGSEDNNLYALNASTGALVWKYATGNWVESSPAVADGMVFVGSEDGKVYAFGFPLSVSISPSVAVMDVGLSLTVTATAKGGAPPYFYYWGCASTLAAAEASAETSPPTTNLWTFTPLSSGTYYIVCIVKDSIVDSSYTYLYPVTVLSGSGGCSYHLAYAC
jgi:outer membrane protein assembly factor BamB